MVHQVLHILGSAQLHNAAVARIVASLAAGLDSGRFRVHAWFLNGGGPLAEEVRRAGAQVRVLPWRTGRHRAADVWWFWHALRSEPFDIIHHHVGGKLLSWLARRSSRGARVVIHVHGRVIEADDVLPREAHIRHADAAIATSHEVARWVRGIRPDVVYAGVEPAAAELLSLSVPIKSRYTIGTACRLVPVKDLTTLVRALAQVRNDVPGVHLEIAGDGPERVRLEKEVAEHGLTGAVTFLGWRADIRTVMFGWNVFALPSLEESLPMAALEAMSVGLPVVASAVGGLSELVVDGETGWLVPAGDVGALAQRLRELLLDPALCHSMGTAGWGRARKYFSIEQMVNATVQIYDRVLRSSRV